MNNIKVQAENEVYERLKLLGEGAFGKAYLVKEKATNELCVVKQMSIADMSPAEQQQTFKEAKILQALNHPCIVKFKEVYLTSNKKLNIVMEYADGGDISKKITEQKKTQKPFSQATILDWFTQMCLAIKHVHDRKIIHRDIKGQNIFITKGNTLKLGDFGIAKILNKTMEKAKTVVGTPYYLSPEIIESKPYSNKSDIWSMGVLLYEMCALKPPFNANSLQFLALKIVKGSYDPLQGNFSKQLKSLISQMLNIDPNRRPSVKQILKLPFILSRIHNYLSETQNQVQFSHTVLHNFKINFKALTPQPKQQAPSYEAERLKLKQDQMRLEKQRQQAKRQEKLREDTRRQERIREEAQKKLLLEKKAQEERKIEDRRKAEEYARQLEQKKRQLELAQQRAQDQHKRQMMEERRQKQEKKLNEQKLKIQQQQERKKYLEFARAEWMRNQEIKENARRRAMMEEGCYQSEPPAPIIEPPAMPKKPTNSAESADSKPKSNYHFKEEPKPKPIERPSSVNKKKEPEPELDDEQLMNAYANPNFQRKKQAQKITQPKKAQRNSSITKPQKVEQLKQESSKDYQNTDLKKKIEQGRLKMKMDRDRYRSGSAADITQETEDTEPSVVVQPQTLKCNKWDKVIPKPGDKKTQQKSVELKSQPKLTQPKSAQSKLSTAPIKAGTEELNEIMKENELLERMINDEIEQEEKHSIEKEQMLAQLKKIVEDVSDKVEAIPQVKVNMQNIRKADQIEPQMATGFQKMQTYGQDELNLDLFSDYNKLQSIRIGLQDAFGTDNFIKAYRIVQRQFEQQGMGGIDIDAIQKKIDFISEELFSRQFTMLLTLVVMQNKVNEQSH